MVYPLIAANWKMHGSRAFARELVREVVQATQEDVVAGRYALLFCPPALLLAEVADSLKTTPFLLGGQDCHPEESGAYTGETSAEMLKDAGASHVILGHSERRQAQGEIPALVAQKVLAAQRAGLTPILCIGEPEAERNAGRAEAWVAEQLRQSLPDRLPEPSRLILAYEPVWAIGSGRVPSLEQIDSMQRHLQQALSERGLEQVPILYGGSLKPDNARAIFALPSVAGGLVGGASLNPQTFHAICSAAREAD